MNGSVCESVTNALGSACEFQGFPKNDGEHGEAKSGKENTPVKYKIKTNILQAFRE